MQNWAIITVGLGSNGLMLCDRDISSSKIERCGYYEGCYGAPYPYYLCAAFFNYAQSETEDTSGASAVAGLLFSLPSESKITAASVRCVTEME